MEGNAGDDLNRRVAEVQGWHIEAKPIACDWDMDFWYSGTKEIIEVLLYKPNTDLNQAVAFAEWLAKKRGTGFNLDYYQDETGSWYQARHSGVWNEGRCFLSAEALCLATLEALGEDHATT